MGPCTRQRPGALALSWWFYGELGHELEENDSGISGDRGLESSETGTGASRHWNGCKSMRLDRAGLFPIDSLDSEKACNTYSPIPLVMIQRYI